MGAQSRHTKLHLLNVIYGVPSFVVPLRFAAQNYSLSQQNIIANVYSKKKKKRKWKRTKTKQSRQTASLFMQSHENDRSRYELQLDRSHSEVMFRLAIWTVWHVALTRERASTKMLWIRPREGKFYLGPGFMLLYRDYAHV